MEVLPCARVAHIERTKKPYNNDIDYYAKRNALRAAEVWMDEYKSHVYMAWNIPMNVSSSSQITSSLRPFAPSLAFLASPFRHAAHVRGDASQYKFQNSDFIPLDLHSGSRAKQQRRLTPN